MTVHAVLVNIDLASLQVGTDVVRFSPDQACTTPGVKRRQVVGESRQDRNCGLLRQLGNSFEVLDKKFLQRESWVPA